jgi:peptidoglycan/LPS O-acetylase OafA/YrhL
MNVGIAILIDYFVRTPRGVVGRVLNTRAMQRIGVLSYSVYLWQQPWLDAKRQGWLTTFPVSLLLTAVCAAASYYVIESPALAYRRQYESKDQARADEEAGLLAHSAP